MAITYNLPLNEWYIDSTSIWTLDYPPLFALYEFLIALIANFFNFDQDLRLTKNVIRTESIIFYQKVTVIASDLVYYYAIYRLCNSIQSYRPLSRPADKKGDGISPPMLQNLSDALHKPDLTSSIALFLILQPCLLLVDHIHFQYNGFLSGFLLLSINYIFEEKYSLASFWFAILLNLKHIYLYCAPAYGLYLLSVYCFAGPTTRSLLGKLLICISRVLELGIIVILVFLITYLPFAKDFTSIKQIISRLFPFKRGLTHSYWAPNFWALYNLADKILAYLFKPPPIAKFDLESISGTHHNSRSLNAPLQFDSSYEHRYLTTIQPWITFSLVALFIVPIILKFILNIGRKCPVTFTKVVALTSMTSFIFGWHVHEKAILLVIIPLIPVALIEKQLYNNFLRVSLLATYSVLPLLYEQAEYITKLCILLAYQSYIVAQKPRTTYNKKLTDSQLSKLKSIWYILYNLFDVLLIWAIIINEVYVIFGQINHPWNPLIRLIKYEFLPLMLTSTICASGIAFSYIELYYHFVLSPIAAEGAIVPKL